MRFVRRVGGFFVNFPLALTILILALVIVHFLLAIVWPNLNVAAALAISDVTDPRSTLSALALGVAAVAAMVGGFAGVVVVFGLGSENDRFRLLRTKGGRRLRASWISVVLSSFAAAFGAVVSSVIVVASSIESGLWVLEFCLLVAAHAAIRLTALLAALTQIVDAVDREADRKTHEIPKASLIPQK